MSSTGEVRQVSKAEQRRAIGRARRALARGLARMRRESGLTWDQITGARIGSRTTIQRWENGEGVPSLPTLKYACLDVYHVDQQTYEDLAMWLVQSNALTTWEENGKGLPDIPGFRTLLDLEDVCDRYRMWSPIVVPGPLQTGPYMDAIFEVSPSLRSADAANMGKIRAERREKLLGNVDISLVMPAEVLIRPIGGREIMQGQIDFLRQLVADGLADVRIVPLEAEAHCGTKGEFMLLDFPEDSGEESTAYFEGWLVSHYTSDDEKFPNFEKRFAELQRHSISLEGFLT